MANIQYKTANLSKFYASHRQRWEHLYISERKVIESTSPDASTRVLDVGAACGGLANALNERFGVTSYVGIEINPQCVEAARELCRSGQVICGDFLSLERDLPCDFDLAFSLSCADWNTETSALLAATFKHLRDGGKLIFSCRLTNEAGAGPIFEARQIIAFSEDEPNEGTAEFAPYKVYTLPSVTELLTSLEGAGDLYGYGYWGTPPSSVRDLPFVRVFYAVFSLEKAARPGGIPRRVFDFSADFLKMS